MRSRSIPGVPVPASVLCLGTAPFGSQQGEDEAFALLDAFAEAGGTTLDSAHVYGAWAPDGVAGGCGNSEQVLGRWLTARGCRERMVVCTKGGHPDFESGDSRLDAGSVQREIAESADRLGGPIDLWWFHRDDPTIPVDEMLGWLAEPVASGAVRAVGCSHWRSERLAQALACAEAGAPRIVASQIAWSLAAANEAVTANRYGEQLAMDGATLAWHRSTGLPIFAYNSQAGGLFAAKYDGLDLLASDFPKPGLTARYGSEQTLRRRAAAAAVAIERGCSTNQVALAWLIDQRVPTTAVIGPRDAAQLEESLGALRVELSPEEVAALAAV